VQAHQGHGGDGDICLLGDVLLLQSADLLALELKDASRQARAGVLDDLLLNECALDPPQLDVEELQSDEELQEAGVVLSSTARPVCPCR
jgi:hypothetical protein